LFFKTICWPTFRIGMMQQRWHWAMPAKAEANSPLWYAFAG
jgi:hypothetical protein